MNPGDVIDSRLAPLAYAHRVLELIGERVRLSDLIRYSMGRWPEPRDRMNELVRMGWAEFVNADGRALYVLDPPPIIQPKPIRYRYGVKITTGWTVPLRKATSSLRPDVSLVADVKPAWCDERWVVEYRAKVKTGWLVRVVQNRTG